MLFCTIAPNLFHRNCDLCRFIVSIGQYQCTGRAIGSTRSTDDPAIQALIRRLKFIFAFLLHAGFRHSEFRICFERNPVRQIRFQCQLPAVFSGQKRIFFQSDLFPCSAGVQSLQLELHFRCRNAAAGNRISIGISPKLFYNQALRIVDGNGTVFVCCVACCIRSISAACAITRLKRSIRLLDICFPAVRIFCFLDVIVNRLTVLTAGKILPCVRRILGIFAAANSGSGEFLRIFQSGNAQIFRRRQFHILRKTGAGLGVRPIERSLDRSARGIFQSRPCFLHGEVDQLVVRNVYRTSLLHLNDIVRSHTIRITAQRFRTIYKIVGGIACRQCLIAIRRFCLYNFI